jgi:hypothetical protein
MGAGAGRWFSTLGLLNLRDTSPDAYGPGASGAHVSGSSAAQIQNQRAPACLCID